MECRHQPCVWAMHAHRGSGWHRPCGRHGAWHHGHGTAATASSHACLPLQVPQDEWSGYPAVGKDGEIPCRRMRSGSYIKAMGDEDSADSDISSKVLPRAATRRDSYRRSSSADQARTK